MNTQTQPDIRREIVIQHARSFGILLILAACVLGYLCIYSPIQEAAAGAPSVSISIMGAFVAVTASVLGPAYLIGGSKFVELIWPPPGPWGVQNYIVFGLTLATAVAAFFALRYYLGTLGYAF